MNERTKQAIKVMEAALLLGVLGDALMRATPWGLNVLLWVGAIVLATIVMLRRFRRRTLTGGGHLLLVAVMLSAAAFAWRDSLMLNFLAGLGLVVALGLMAWRARAGRIWLGGITEYALGLMVAGVNAFLVGFPALFLDVSWREVPLARGSRHLRSIALGAIIALPLLVLFGGLLMSADAAFERIVLNLFASSHKEAVGHILLALALAWMTGGFLRGLLLGREVKIVDGRAVLFPPLRVRNAAAGVAPALNTPVALKAETINLGIVEIGVALGLLNMLFLTFVLVQLRYFFGGAALVQASDGLTFAEYYRRGFFELVTVAALVLPLLLGMHWLLRKERRSHERIFRALASAQVFLLFVIMASAVRRMLLYQSVYGLTEQRVYTTAFMAWLALVFIWFVATALRGRREQFACGALVAGLVIIAALHVINPDAVIVRVNVERARAGHPFDVHYLSSLSADAVPALMQSLPALSEDERRIVAARMLEDRELGGKGADWRNWNWSRTEMRRLVEKNIHALRMMIVPADGYKVKEPPTIAAQTVEAAGTLKPAADGPKQVKPKPAGGQRTRLKPAR